MRIRGFAVFAVVVREAPVLFLRSYRGTRPRFASGTLMSLRTIPPFRAGGSRSPSGCGRVFRVAAQRAALGPATGACRCTFRKRHQGTLSGALRSEARRERSAREGGFPCRSVGRCAPVASLGGERNEDEHRPSANPSANHNSKTANKYGNPGRVTIDDTPGIPVHY